MLELLDIIIGIGIGYFAHRLSKQWSWTLVVALHGRPCGECSP
jgi:hypothetical protein